MSVNGGVVVGWGSGLKLTIGVSVGDGERGIDFERRSRNLGRLYRECDYSICAGSEHI
jgi:hypothetical protein